MSLSGLQNESALKMRRSVVNHARRTMYGHGGPVLHKITQRELARRQDPTPAAATPAPADAQPADTQPADANAPEATTQDPADAAAQVSNDDTADPASEAPAPAATQASDAGAPADTEAPAGGSTSAPAPAATTPAPAPDSSSSAEAPDTSSPVASPTEVAANDETNGVPSSTPAAAAPVDSSSLSASLAASSTAGMGDGSTSIAVAPTNARVGVSNSSSHSSSPNLGAILGGSLGGAAALVFLILLAYIYARRQSRQRDREADRLAEEEDFQRERAFQVGLGSSSYWGDGKDSQVMSESAHVPLGVSNQERWRAFNKSPDWKSVYCPGDPYYSSDDIQDTYSAYRLQDDTSSYEQPIGQRAYSASRRSQQSLTSFSSAGVPIPSENNDVSSEYEMPYGYGRMPDYGEPHTYGQTQATVTAAPDMFQAPQSLHVVNSGYDSRRLV